MSRQGELVDCLDTGVAISNNLENITFIWSEVSLYTNFLLLCHFKILESVVLYICAQAEDTEFRVAPVTNCKGPQYSVPTALWRQSASTSNTHWSSMPIVHFTCFLRPRH